MCRWMRNPNTYKPKLGEKGERGEETEKKKKIGRWKDSKAIREIQRTLEKKAKMSEKRRRGEGEKGKR
jgi:hypothetical protein